jgi:superfamily II DNA or RNA helicase
VPSDVDDKDIVIAMVQSAANWPTALLDAFGTVAVDEAHCLGARSLAHVLPKFRARYKLAVTATPTRRDGLEHAIYALAGPSVYVYRRLPAITGERGTVEIDAVRYGGGARTEITDYKGQPAYAQMLGALATDPERTADLVQECVALLRMRRKVLVLTKLVAHADTLHDAIVAAAATEPALLPTGTTFTVYGASPPVARAAARAPHTRLVCATAQLLGEGEMALAWVPASRVHARSSRGCLRCTAPQDGTTTESTAWCWRSR